MSSPTPSGRSQHHKAPGARLQFVCRWGSLAAIALTLGACSSTPAPGENPNSEGELQVITTFFPITQFTQAVAGDRAQVTQLLPNSAGPHDYQAKPAEVQAIATADVLVLNGLGLETFLDSLVANAGNPDLVMIDSSEGIPTLDGVDDHGGLHDHDVDPHIWLDPKRAVAQVETIREGLIAADPEGEAEYADNAKAYIERLQALDQDIAEKLAPYSGQTYISFHDVTGYFADSYSLNAKFLVDVPEENPSPEDVRTVIEAVETESIKVLLSEPQAGDAFAALAKDLDVAVGLFDPMETGNSTDPEAYLFTMRQNVDSIEAALTRP